MIKGFLNTGDKGVQTIGENAEWLVSVSERRVGRTRRRNISRLISYILTFAAALVAFPILIGLSIMPEPSVVLHYVYIMVPLLAAAILFQVLSKQGPRNSVQVDYAANEVRLGSKKPDGTFVRHTVWPFHTVNKVYIDKSPKGEKMLCLRAGPEVASIRLADVDERSLTLLASQISAACQDAEKMPLTSRITSQFIGLEASAKEVGERVRSRVVSRGA